MHPLFQTKDQVEVQILPQVQFQVQVLIGVVTQVKDLARVQVQAPVKDKVQTGGADPTLNRIIDQILGIILGYWGT